MSACALCRAGHSRATGRAEDITLPQAVLSLPGGRAVEKRPTEEKASTATVCWTRAEHGTAGRTASGSRPMLGGLSGPFPRQALSPSPIERKCWPRSSLKPLLALISLEHSHLSGSNQLGRQRDGTPLGTSQPHFAPPSVYPEQPTPTGLQCWNCVCVAMEFLCRIPRALGQEPGIRKNLGTTCKLTANQEQIKRT